MAADRAARAWRFRALLVAGCVGLLLAVLVAVWRIAPPMGRVCRQTIAPSQATTVQLARGLRDTRCPEELRPELIRELAGRRPIPPAARDELLRYLRELPISDRWDFFQGQSERFTWISPFQNRLLKELLDRLSQRPGVSVEILLQELVSDQLGQPALRIAAARAYFDYLSRWGSPRAALQVLPTALGTSGSAREGPGRYVATCLSEQRSPDPFRPDSVCLQGISLAGDRRLVALLRDALVSSFARDPRPLTLEGLSELCEVAELRFGSQPGEPVGFRPQTACGPEQYLAVRQTLLDAPFVDDQLVERFERSLAFGRYDDRPADALAQVPLGWLLSEARRFRAHEEVVNRWLTLRSREVLGNEVPVVFADRDRDGTVGEQELEFAPQNSNTLPARVTPGQRSRLCAAMADSWIRCAGLP